MDYGSALDITPIQPESNLKCVYRANDSVRQVGSLPIVIIPRLSRVSRPDDRDTNRIFLFLFPKKERNNEMKAPTRDIYWKLDCKYKNI